MIDIHSHILPGIDDGSRSIDETMAMLKEAENAGFREIITTPHYFEGYYEADERTRASLDSTQYVEILQKEVEPAKKSYTAFLFIPYGILSIIF